MITLDQIAELRKSCELMNEMLTLAERQLRQKPNTNDVPEWCRAAAKDCASFTNRDEWIISDFADCFEAIIARHAREAK
jgi:hypothetical protein